MASDNNTTMYLDRFLFTDTETIGVLTHNGNALAFTLEPAISESPEYPHPAIPAGSYRVVWRPNGRIATLYRRKGFEGSLQLENVSHREAIEIHAGNDHRDTEGCILLGLSVRDIRQRPGVIERSHQAVDAFYTLARNIMMVNDLFLSIMSISGYDFDDR